MIFSGWIYTAGNFPSTTYHFYYLRELNMEHYAISAKRIFDGERFHTHSSLVWQGETIVGIFPTSTVDEKIIIQHYAEGIITPGFIDIQVNGGGGVMFNEKTDVDGIDTICKAHRKHGTAYLLPTLISDTPRKIHEALTAAQNALDCNTLGILGIHIEGPWINPAKKGAHNESLFFDPQISMLESLPWLKSGTTLITLAPEKVNNESIKWLSKKGAILSCGHSNATTQELDNQYFNAISGFTHLYNAMSPLEGRQAGVVGKALMTDNAWCSIITDNIHVSKESALLAHRVKPKGKLLIVTDAMASVGSKSPSFTLNDEIISVVDNKLVNTNGNLAGAHIGMDESVANVIKWGIDEAEAFKMASTYPAIAIKQERLGKLKEGFYASATILAPNYEAQHVLVNGILF